MKKYKILIIDDSKTYLLYITELLLNVGNLELKTLLDPREALQTALDFSPDLILTDFEMPYLNGNQICTLFKTSPQLSIIPIMMLTSNNNEKSLIKAIESGANDYLYKASDKAVVISR